ncbi:MAG: lactonase family protein, partial [Muribaculaceae bacterium]|nr:lactonase family protein [Muribaculaceae bacterium]
PGEARSAADLHLRPDGRFLYARVRQPSDCITIYSVDGTTGELTETGRQKTGLHPRNFNITPNGKYLLCACRDSDRIDVYRIDTATGMLTDIGRPIMLPRPVCVKWAR